MEENKAVIKAFSHICSRARECMFDYEDTKTPKRLEEDINIVKKFIEERNK